MANETIITGKTFRDHPTLLRLVDDKGGGKIRRCTFVNPTGPAGEDGQCIQLIRPRDGIWLIEDCLFEAGPGAEDLLSDYGAPDRKAKIKWTARHAAKCIIIVRRCKFVGRGDSDSSTSICADGPYPPRMLVEDNEFIGARVAMQIAGGTGHVVRNNSFRDCEHTVLVHPYYGVPIGPCQIEKESRD